MATTLLNYLRIFSGRLYALQFDKISIAPCTFESITIEANNAQRVYLAPAYNISTVNKTVPRSIAIGCLASIHSLPFSSLSFLQILIYYCCCYSILNVHSAVLYFLFSCCCCCVSFFLRFVLNRYVNFALENYRTRCKSWYCLQFILYIYM